MQLDTWLTYVITILILMSTPGPSHLLMLSNSLTNGFSRSLATGAGDLTANALQMLAATLGLVTIIQSSQTFFLVVKWAGVAYLIYLGLRLWIGGPHKRFEVTTPRSLNSLYWQGFVTSASNPKAIIFFAALFPQFLSLSQPSLPQFGILCLTYVVIDGLFLLAYGKAASWLATHIGKLKGSLKRLSGGLIILAAILLGAKEVETR